MDESCDARTKKQTAEWRAKETLIDVAFEIADDDDFEKGAKEQDAGKEHEKGNDAPKNHTVAFIDKTFGNGADECRYEIARRATDISKESGGSLCAPHTCFA